MTGCEFAKLFPGKAGKVAIELHVDTDLAPTAWLNNALDEHARAERVVITVLPCVTSEATLVDFLNALGTDARWAIRRRAKTAPSGGVLVGLEWTTALGDVTDVMGFAPFPSMPVPRRAPYVAMATWPGGCCNPFRGRAPTPPGRPGIVSFLDASHGLEESQYEALWAKTSARVSSLMSVPPDDPRLYRRTAFVLSEEHATRLRVT